MKHLAACLRIVFYFLSVFMTAIFASYLLFVYWGPDPSHVFLAKTYTQAELLNQEIFFGLKNTAFEHIKTYFFEIMSLDFSYSFAQQRPALELIYEALPLSFFIGLPAFFLSELLALALAAWFCIQKNRWTGSLVSMFVVLSLSLPSVLIVLSCQLFLCSTEGLDLFPVQGWPFEEGCWAVVYYSLAPTLSLVLCLIGPRFHYAYELLSGEFSQDYLRTHQAFGFSRFFLVFVQVMKNILPLFIMRGLPRLCFVMIAGLMLVEHVFSLPGLGSLFAAAAQSGDWPVMKAFLFINSLFYLLCRLATEFICAWLRVDRDVEVRI